MYGDTLNYHLNRQWIKEICIVHMFKASYIGVYPLFKTPN